MCSFEAVIHPCPVLGDWVRTDQTRADCGGEHACDSFLDCPLKAQFTDAVSPVEAHAKGDLRDWCVV